MIIDKTSNIEKYNEISKEVKEFIKNLSTDIDLGKHVISETVYANVEEYLPKTHDKCFFEVHKKYADIQILLSGTERIDFVDENKLIIKDEYDEKRDIMFFENTIEEDCRLKLDGSNFALIFPNEAHRPQMRLDSEKPVKKVVVKILM